ncbi:hypothetical protein EUGRSUZ_F03721 [Eucalyptus grandis]|uniref:Uncharacterized protein n=2 Tax=Eucalyptus grandis TaxID=71139 RepID=A0ACC3KMA5_EUCGR|nr:hypothetical protein EUGRSUZ_F03721 [Eucalyptus grandis]
MEFLQIKIEEILHVNFLPIKNYSISIAKAAHVNFLHVLFTSPTLQTYTAASFMSTGTSPNERVLFTQLQ